MEIHPVISHLCSALSFINQQAYLQREIRNVQGFLTSQLELHSISSAILLALVSHKTQSEDYPLVGGVTEFAFQGLWDIQKRIAAACILPPNFNSHWFCLVTLDGIAPSSNIQT